MTLQSNNCKYDDIETDYIIKINNILKMLGIKLEIQVVKEIDFSTIKK